MSDLASVIIGEPDDVARVPQLRQGIVTAVSPLMVRVGSATTAQVCNALGSYVPSIGDAVSVLVLSGDRLVLGAVGARRGLEYASGVYTTGAVSVPSVGTYDTALFSLGLAPWDVRVHCHVDTYFGNGTGWVNGYTDVYRFVDASGAPATPVSQAIAGAWTNSTVDWSWGVPAGQNMSFKTRYTCTQTQPSMSAGWYDVRVTYQVVNI